MDAKIVGIHTTTKKLASGMVRAYAYASRNGAALCNADGRTAAEAYKRLRERLGTVDVLGKIHAKRGNQTPAKTVETLVIGYRGSPEYTALSADTKRDYLYYIEAFREEFGHYSLKLFENRPDAAADVLDWRDERWNGKFAAMDHCIRAISAMFAWGRMRRLTTAIPFTKVARVHHPNRADMIWSDEQIGRFREHSSKNVGDIVKLVSETALRQKDVLKLLWSDLHLDAEPPYLVRRTSKSKRQIVVPLTDEAIALLRGVPKLSPVVFTNTYGKPWTPSGFRTSFGRAYKKAKLTGVNFHDLRGTAITKLVTLGVEPADIGRIAGWGLEQVEALLRVYVGATKRDVDMMARIKQKRDATNQ